MCLVLVSNSVLQAYGHVNLPIVTTLVGGGVKIVANYYLVAIPEINIYGAPIGLLLCYTVTLLLNLVLLRRRASGIGGYVTMFGKPLLASAVMGGAAWAVYGLAEKLLGNTLALGAAIAVAVLIYLILVLALRVVSREDVMLMPKGEKIAKILKI